MHHGSGDAGVDAEPAGMATFPDLPCCNDVATPTFASLSTDEDGTARSFEHEVHIARLNNIIQNSES